MTIGIDEYRVGYEDHEAIALKHTTVHGRLRTIEVTLGAFKTAEEARAEAERSTDGLPWVVVTRRVVAAGEARERTDERDDEPGGAGRTEAGGRSDLAQLEDDPDRARGRQ